jgi:hypothetical protein
MMKNQRTVSPGGSCGDIASPAKSTERREHAAGGASTGAKPSPLASAWRARRSAKSLHGAVVGYDPPPGDAGSVAEASSTLERGKRMRLAWRARVGRSGGALI